MADEKILPTEAKAPAPVTVPAPPVHETALNEKQADDPDKNNTAINTPAKKDEKAPAAPAPSTLKADLDKIADEVKDNKPKDGSVTLDFGKAGKLTGCLIMSNSTALAGGPQVVAVPFEGGYVQVSGVPQSAVK